jgi:hypothetical protein
MRCLPGVSVGLGLILNSCGSWVRLPGVSSGFLDLNLNPCGAWVGLPGGRIPEILGLNLNPCGSWVGLLGFPWDS